MYALFVFCITFLFDTYPSKVGSYGFDGVFLWASAMNFSGILCNKSRESYLCSVRCVGD